MTREDAVAEPPEAAPSESIAEQAELTPAEQKRAAKQERQTAKEKRAAAAASARLAVDEVLIRLPVVVRRGTRENFQLATREQYAELRSFIPKLERVLKALKENRRSYRGQQSSRQFSAEEIREIRTCYERGGKFAELGRKYGANETSIRDICLRVTYREVE